MPEEYPQEFHDAAEAAIRYARNTKIFAHLDADTREKALQSYVADVIGRILTPWIVRHLENTSQKMN